MFPPERIICLTEETVETLYLLGEESRIVGISGYVVRPPRARREKPRVSAFEQIGLDRAFTIHDREDSADLLNLLRHDLAKKSIRLPSIPLGTRTAARSLHFEQRRHA